MYCSKNALQRTKKWSWFWVKSTDEWTWIRWCFFGEERVLFEKCQGNFIGSVDDMVIQTLGLKYWIDKPSVNVLSAAIGTQHYKRKILVIKESDCKNKNFIKKEKIK